MLPKIRSEFRKFFSTRMWWGMAIGVAAAGAIFALINAFVLTSDAMMGPDMPTGDDVQIASSVYTGGIGIAYVLLLTIGVLHIGGEYRHKTITATFLASPKRTQVLLAKAASLVGIGALYAVISLASAVIVGALVLSLRDQDAFPSPSILRTLALSLLILGLWALIGLGVGILIPNQVAALLVAIGVAFIVEPLVGVALSFWDFGAEYIAPYLPTAATNAALDVVQQPGAFPLAWWGGLLVLAAYALVLAGIGIMRAAREDIS